MRQWIIDFSARHPLLAAICVVVAMIVGFIDGLWSLAEKLAPLAVRATTSLDWPSLSLGWLPWVTTPIGLVLLGLIYRQTRQVGPRSNLPLGNPRRIPKDRHVKRKHIRIADWADESNRIRNLTFEECIIEGPGVLATTGHTQITSPSFTGSELPMMVVPEGYSAFGVIGVEHGTFIRCLFHRVGLAVTARGAEQLRASVRRGLSR